ncbi:MAG TPA: tetratricopeptide repeat protein [Myxococcota bacterium]|nr:tetratricopeptide repeat protein [Myxococcota bacterium]
MRRHLEQSGKVKIGLVLFVALLIAVTVRYVYYFTDKATRLTEEAKELMGSDKFDSALEKLDEAVAEDPESVPAHYHRGICLAERHRFDEALLAFARVSELDPEEANSYFNSGKIHWYQERYSEALAPLQKAIDLQKRLEKANRGFVWLLLGDCLYELYLDKLANDPEHAGSPSRAVAAFKTYLKERPGAADKGAVEQKLQIMEKPEDFKEVIAKHKQTVKK